MTAEEWLYQRLAASAPVVAIASTRIYMGGNAPQGVALPFVVSTLLDAEEINHLTGSSGLIINQIQVDSFSTTYKTARQLGDAIRITIGGLGPRQYADFYLHAAVLERTRTTAESPIDGSEFFVHRVSQDWRIAENAPIPVF